MYKRIVIKFGTTSLTNNTLYLSPPNLLEYVRQINKLHSQGIQIIIVSSGAVAAGMELLKQPKFSKNLPAKQMLSSVGQGRLIQIWSELFGFYGINIGQLLLTKGDLSDRNRYLNVRDTIETLLAQKVIPIINENDSVATEEIKLGDNDNLSALVANTVAADLLLILTDQGGLFDKNPRQYPDAKLIQQIDTIDDGLYKIARGGSELGTGGMYTKVKAAQIATQSGINTIIAPFYEENVILKVFKKEKIGTTFHSKINPRESKRRWIFSEQPVGTLIIDEGAKKQLLEKGASLLPIGIIAVTGTFNRGSIVKIFTENGSFIGMGMVNYSSSEIEKIIKCHSSLIEDKLGYSYGNEVIHRDNMLIEGK